MTRNEYDVLVIGGGPAGAAAAWRAASSGAKTLCLDKASFPRNKACGDGLTPRSVGLIAEMGLAGELERFHRVDGVRFLGERSWQFGWPERSGFPTTGYVASRLELDEMLLNQAGLAGADIWQSAEAVAPILTNGRIGGVVVRQRGKPDKAVTADAVVAADGAYSPMKRAVELRPVRQGVMGIAIRAEMESTRCDTRYLEIYPRISYGNGLLPGYGWVFPLGGGRINCGVGYLLTYRGWRDINAARIFEQFLSSLPGEWGLPTAPELNRRKSLRAWRLPMAFTGPAWQPGVLFAGDAVGAIKPLTGAGISRALQSGMAAASSAVDALGSGGPADFSNYERYLTSHWGRQYRWGRRFLSTAGKPRSIAALYGVLDSPPIRRAIIRAGYGSAGAAQYLEGPLPPIELTNQSAISAVSAPPAEE